MTANEMVLEMSLLGSSKDATRCEEEGTRDKEQGKKVIQKFFKN
jgi:hypothetical protein